MTETELELFQLKMSIMILEKLVLKTCVLTGMQAGLSLEKSVQATLHSIELDDALVQHLFSGLKLDSAQIGLQESELREVVDRMRSCVLELQKEVEQRGKPA